ncbi:hypothetical protein ElyMa_006543900 [Elysia marginata]|uniref:Uncharacterized protein n=1 Tax=Elysia marginata TaxID=1093978 RepID=A0AAV4I803_9GAST|nr:hypothetical protein ElyMa_006543900 [Elysia marginata]
MNSNVYRQRRPNEQHARPEPTATKLIRLQLRHGPAPTAAETLGLGLDSSSTSEPTDDSTPQMTADEDLSSSPEKDEHNSTQIYLSVNKTQVSDIAQYIYSKTQMEMGRTRGENTRQ